ncbi:hypothetical protein M432DRAFT_467294 [Thermoascus aurantiacus ATCC 26904]
MDLATMVTSNGPDPVAESRRESVYKSPTFQRRTYEHHQETASSKSYFAPSTSTAYTWSPQPPLSPPAEDQRKCSLPSISTLLQGADDLAIHASKRQRPVSPTQRDADSRGYPQTNDHVMLNGSKVFLPPTPPLRPGSGFHSNSHSPSASSSHSAVSTSNVSGGSSLRTPDPYQQQHPPHTLPTPTEPLPASQGSHSRYLGPPYASPAPSIGAYASPVEPPASAAYYQGPPQSGTYKPQNYVPPPPPPPMAPSAHPQMISPVNPAWQHHHYFPPSSSTPYPQNNDRYVCRTCHKAFSRPSSLRIHSHSHTGEKPFRCTHAGCGKAFSVRSNMKRHERGCHSGRQVTATLV